MITFCVVSNWKGTLKDKIAMTITSLLLDSLYLIPMFI